MSASSYQTKITLIMVNPLTGATLIAADKFYAVIKGKELLAAHQLASDPVRAELDEFVLKELLKINAANLKAWLGMVATLRKKLGSEPSFNGGK